MLYPLSAFAEGESSRGITCKTSVSPAPFGFRVGRPGIAWIGLTEYQDPLDNRDFLLRKFGEGKFSGVSAAILSRSGTYLEPPRRSVIDIWMTISNPQMRFPLPRAIPFKPLDVSRTFSPIGEVGVPAYRVNAAEIESREGQPTSAITRYSHSRPQPT